MKDWKPTANLKALKLRADLYALIRRFFAERGVLEVETPVLSQAGNSDPNIESFRLQFEGPRSAGNSQRWLRTSPEYAMKRLLAAGVGDCYELGRVFRNGEAGKRHNPEFTMLEWYRVGWTQHQLMDEVSELLKAALAMAGRRATVRDVSFHKLYEDKFGFDPLTASEGELRAPLAVYDIDGKGLTRDDWLDLLMTHLIQPSIPANRVLLVYDYPANQCALAKIRPGDPPVAERFEAYLGPLEVANGYHELTDAEEQRQRFEREVLRRCQRGQTAPAFDERLLAALPKMPACSGVALGIDRLLMALAGTDKIADVVAFPFDRA
ncbi:MAG TPA: EF-P lysine aminoacylase EpmA [Arenimonas sp.]|nr:EF-P lysine aminoacylase EpmA [Arenimonas sp.]